MKNKDYRSSEIISVDIGTTNLKITLFNQHYQQKHSVIYNYLKYAESGFDPSQVEVDFLWTLFIKGLEEISDYVETPVCDLALTTAMHSVILCDQRMNPVSPIYTWLWSGPNGGYDLINFEKESHLSARDIYHMTGTPAHMMNPFYKLGWLLKEKESASLKIASIKDLFFYRLTKEWWLDAGSASASGLCSLKTHDWELDILALLGLERQQLPEIKAFDVSRPYKGSNNKLKRLNMEIFLGSSDGISSNYIYQGETNAAVLSLGTSHAVRLISSKPITDYLSQNFCYYINPQQYLIGYPSNNAGNVIDWLLTEYNITFEEMEAIIATGSYQIPPRSLFMPFVFGERSPLWNPHQTAYFMGETAGLTLEEKVYSIVCGLCFNIRYNVEQLNRRCSFNYLKVVGGLARSKEFLKLLANIIGSDLESPLLPHAETLGTVALIDQVRLTPSQKVVSYDSQAHKAFDACYESFFMEIKVLKSLEF